MRSRSGAPRSASSRSRFPQPTSRPGSATPTLVDVDDNRFRIAVPNGFAKDWLESRYRSLISQTLARIVGYSVQVEFVVGTAPEVAEEPRTPASRARDRRANGRSRPRARQQVRLEADAGRRRGRLDQPQPPLHVRELHRRLGQPPCPCGEPLGRGAAGARLQPAVPVRRRRPRQDPPDARHREPGHRRSSRASGSSTRRPRSSRTSSSRRSSRARSTSSGRATDGSTSSSSTTSSSSPTRNGPRRSSSTPSMRSTRTASRSS